MRRFSKPTLLVLAAFLAAHIAAARPHAQTADASPAKLYWFKGNTHTHTSNSDGDSTPDEVVQWYKSHLYDFVILTDHEHITPVDGLNSKFGNGGKFLVIQGQEVTDRFNKKPYHVNGLGLERVVMPMRGTDVVSNIQKNVNAVREARGIPQINHPNFGWAISVDDLIKVQGAPLLEIYSGHPLVNMMGGGGAPGVEDMWDSVLSSGRIYWGVAVDDSHHFKSIGDDSAATPGHGWVVVRAAKLSPAAILSALEAGDFYASSGVELEDYSVTPASITIMIREKKGRRYRTQFIGRGGNVLAESIMNPAVYRFRGTEKFVRAKILESNGKAAWTQPVFRKRK